MRINVCSLTKQYFLKLRHTEIYKQQHDKNIKLKKNHSSGSKFNTHKTTRHAFRKCHARRWNRHININLRLTYFP